MAKQSRGSKVDGSGTTPTTAERRRQMIATAAYYRAARRAFRDGGALADWLEAEAEIDRLLKQLLVSENQQQAAVKPATREGPGAQERDFDTGPEDLAGKAQEAGRRARQARKAARSAR